MKRALAIILREKSLKADLADAVRTPSKDVTFARTYAVVAGHRAARHREHVKDVLTAFSHFGAINVFTPDELDGVQGDIGDARAYADYLGEVLWRKQASKERLEGLGVYATPSNVGALMAAAALTATDAGMFLWDAERGARFVDLLQPRDQLLNRLLNPIHSITAATGIDEILGESERIRSLRETLRTMAPLPFPVLLIGETGSGKELCAQALHELSPRARTGRFVAVNSAFLADDRMADSQLFGHIKGAFTGADRARQGRIKEAEGGTLFLDELDSLALGTQARLLRALGRVNDSRLIFAPVGADQDEETPCDVRLIAAIHHDEGSDFGLRSDLYHRVSTITIRVPPLREHREDVLLLANDQLRKLQVQFKEDRPLTLKKEAERLLHDHQWPGNVRELQRVMIQGYLAARDRRDRTIGKNDLEPHLRRTAGQFDDLSTLELQVARFKVAAAEYALARHPGNKTVAAKELGYRSGQDLERMLRREREKLPAGYGGRSRGK